ncbi:MAG: hypothetical protein KAY48_03115, partial [Saprospiraceae bacterium]|nr:hypothetical protein [Saprospiraceae bacterium]
VATVPFFSNDPINWNDNPDMLQAYKDIMAFYTQSDVARLGTNKDYSTDEAIIFTKTLGAEQLFILVNTRNATIEPTLPPEFNNVYWTDALTGDTLQFGATVQMYNYRYVIARR